MAHHGVHVDGGFDQVVHRGRQAVDGGQEGVGVAAVQVGEQVQHGLLVRPGEGGAFHFHVGEQGGLGLRRQVCEGAGQGGGVLRIQLAQGGQQLDLVLGGQGDAVDGHRGEEGLQHPLRQGEEEGLLLAGVCGPGQAGQGLLEGLLLGGGEVRGGQDGPRLLGELGLVPQAGGDGLGHGL